MATHSSILAWRIPGTGEPGGLLSIGSQSQTQLKRFTAAAAASIVVFLKLFFIVIPLRSHFRYIFSNHPHIILMPQSLCI